MTKFISFRRARKKHSFSVPRMQRKLILNSHSISSPFWHYRETTVAVFNFSSSQRKRNRNPPSGFRFGPRTQHKSVISLFYARRPPLHGSLIVRVLENVGKFREWKCRRIFLCYSCPACCGQRLAGSATFSTVLRK